jgi:hypothetical protein
LRPADFFCCVVPPWDAVLFERDPDPDFFPPRLDEPGEFAMRAARCLDMPFFFRPSYCFSFLTLGLLFGTSYSSLYGRLLSTQARRAACPDARQYRSP